MSASEHLYDVTPASFDENIERFKAYLTKYGDGEICSREAYESYESNFGKFPLLLTKRLNHPRCSCHTRGGENHTEIMRGRIGALRKCAAEGHFEALVWLLDRWKVINEDIMSDDYAMFKAAAYRGHLNILKHLVNRVGPHEVTTPPTKLEMLMALAQQKCDDIKPHEHDIEVRKQEVFEYISELK